MRRRLVAIILALAAGPAGAQVTRPKPPARYDAAVRVATRTDTEGRLRDLRAILDSLKQLGFNDTRLNPDLDKFDPTANTITGDIASGNADRILGVPGVKAVLLTPAGFAPAPGGAEVRVTIPGGLDTDGRRALHSQTVQLLKNLGFRQHLGGDDAGFRQIRGSLPTADLPKLLDDLRLQPAGWFLPRTLPDELPRPVRDTPPIRVVEVLPVRPDAAPTPVEPPLPPELAPIRAKLSPELALALAGPDAAKQTRIEVLLTGEPRGDWPAVRQRLRDAALGVSVDGLVGTVVSLRVQKVADLAAISAVPYVASLRVPQVGESGGSLVADAAPDSLREWLDLSRVGQLHAAGETGKGTTIAIIAAEFPDAGAKLGAGLPADTTSLDLTASLDPELRPRAAGRGIGTAAAMAASAAAPSAKIVLVRIDPAAAFQLLTVARAAGGERDYSDALAQRSLELQLRRDELTARRGRVERDYAAARASERLDDAGPARLDAARQAFETLKADEARLAGANERFRSVKAGLDSLRGTTVLCNTLTWPVGYPQDGLSEISRYLEENLAPAPVRSSRRLAQASPHRPVWVQATSTAAGRVWAGPLLDADGDGLLEFTPSPGGEAGEWKHELNFLRFAPAGGPLTDTIPAGTKLRVVTQWREPRGAAGTPGVPALAFRPRILRQLDPSGEKLASDEVDLAAGVTSPPMKLLETRSSDAYEQSVELTVPVAGRYALQVDFGPAGKDLLPGTRQVFEVNPRVVLETPGGGEVRFGTYAPNDAGVGVPGDSAAALTVGAPVVALSGGGPGVTLKVKPDLTAPAKVTVGGVTLEGPAAGAALVAGGAASLAQSGVRADSLTRTLGLEPGQRFEVPAAWLASLAARRR